MERSMAETLGNIFIGMLALRYGEKDPEAGRTMAEMAIRTMRELTPAMISEGESAASFGIGKPVDDQAIPRVWNAMLDAALSRSQAAE